MLEWLSEDRVPTPQELDKLSIAIEVGMLFMSNMHNCPVKLAIILLLRLTILVEAFEEGLRRVTELLKADPLFQLLMLFAA